MSRLLPKGLRRFFGKSDGSATIEALLWFPVFFGLFGLMVDATMIFNGHSRVLRVVQDANRNLSVGRLSTEAETEDWIIAALAGVSPNVQVTTIITSGVATTTALVPAVDLEILGLFGALNGLTISVVSQHYIEF